MNHTLRAKQQKANLDKLDKILANLPEAQYDHSEEEVPAKKSKTKKSAESVKKQPRKRKLPKKRKRRRYLQKKKPAGAGIRKNADALLPLPKIRRLK